MRRWWLEGFIAKETLEGRAAGGQGVSHDHRGRTLAQKEQLEQRLGARHGGAYVGHVWGGSQSSLSLDHSEWEKRSC